MKRLSTLIVLLGLVMGSLMTGCGEKPPEAKAPDAGAVSNAPTPPPAPSTNK